MYDRDLWIDEDARPPTPAMETALLEWIGQFYEPGKTPKRIVHLGGGTRLHTSNREEEFEEAVTILSLVGFDDRAYLWTPSTPADLAGLWQVVLDTVTS